MRFRVCMLLSGLALKLGALCLIMTAKLNRRADLWLKRARGCIGGGGG